MVLDRPEIPLHTNGSENDIRCHVTRRKVSGGTRSDVGRDCRDAFLGLAKTCAKLGIAFWEDLCGISAKERALEVDHILPRRHGGTDDLSNLQALCYKCNANKGARDDSDLRGVRARMADRSAELLPLLPRPPPDHRPERAGHRTLRCPPGDAIACADRPAAPRDYVFRIYTTPSGARSICFLIR